MNKKYIIIMSAILCLFYYSSCEKVQDGYISDTILYYTNPIIVSSGVTSYSITPNLGGSSYPVKFELLDVKDSLGNSTDELTKLRDLYIWNAPYNSLTDTTLDLILAKREISESDVTMKLIEGSGQFLFTEATSQCKDGTYSVSMKMSNSAGERIFNDVVKIKLQSIPYKEVTLNWNIALADPGFVDPGGPGGWMSQYMPKLEMVNDPEGPNKIHIQVCDKNGSPFSWKKGEIVPRGDRPRLELATPWSKPEYTDTEAIFEYPFVPFPFGVTTSEGVTTDYWYYRIVANHCAIDGYVPQKWHNNILFGFFWYQPGEWFVKMTWPMTTRIP